MARETDADKVTRFETALTQLIGRIAEDRYVLAVVASAACRKQPSGIVSRSGCGSLKRMVSADACKAMAMRNASFASWSKTASTFTLK